MSTTTMELALPTDGDSARWTEQEKALVKAAGLVRSEKRGGETTEYLADRPTVEAFLAHCRRTGLDPIARQIYAIYRAGKWGIQISIDGARLVAERTRTYEGQTPVQWTADGVTWVDVWLSDDYPKAARVGVYRRGFREPLYAVATWDSYAVMNDVWERGQKTGEKKVSDMWAKFGPLMLGKCAEMLALRKAFPQDLSGLYSTEEMQQAGAAAEPVPVPAVQPAVHASEPVVDDRDWNAEVDATTTVEALTGLANEAQKLGVLGMRIGMAGDNDDGSAFTLFQVLTARKAELEAAARESVPLDVTVEKARPRRWADEARAMKTAEDVTALWHEASKAEVAPAVLDDLLQISTTKRSAKAEATVDPGWAPLADATDEAPWSAEDAAEAEAAAAEVPDE